VKSQKGAVGAITKEIQQIEQRKDKIVKENGEYELEIKKLDHDIAKIQSESKECLAKVRYFTSNYHGILVLTPKFLMSYFSVM
jgi:septal ring factor EnvC (AmiA/AmiB activator)